MRYIYINLLFTIFAFNIKFSSAKDVELTSKNFQKDFLTELGETMKASAVDYLNNFLKGIKKPAYVDETFDEELKIALESKKLETKIIFIKQWLDLAENKDTNRKNMYGLRNVKFLNKLKDRFAQLQDESFDEIHQLRYFYLCKQFKVNSTEMAKHHNLYSQNTQLVPINEHYVGDMLQKLGVKDNHTVSINISEFGTKLYEKVNHAGAEIINDYLVIIRKLLQEVLENKSEEMNPHSEALQKILLEIDALLNTSDFYAKRQRLYDYLQNHLAVDYEQFQNSENSQQDILTIFDKLKQKGLDLVVAFLFSNFEFIDYLHEQWSLQLPQAPLSLYDTRTRQLKRIQDLYAEFKQDFENSSKYDAYLEAVKLLHEQTQHENADNSHIYELLYSASQNVGSSRATLMNSKCNEI